MGRTPAWILVAIVGLAALLRFPTLDLQSYWFDETVTTVDVLRPSLIATIERVPSQELAPPFYFVLAWFWSQVFGTGEAGLRALSAVIGVLTVPAAYGAARRLATPRAGLVAAALVATNPLLVWYSQEARHYALLALMGTVTLLCVARALDDPGHAALGWWAMAAAGALATHYFAAFLVVPEALLLMWAARQRLGPTLAAVGAVAAAGAALLPLAIHQRGSGGANWIAAIPLSTRLPALGEKFLAGWPGAENPAWPVVLPVVAVAAWTLVKGAGARERRGAAVALGLGGATLLVAAALALTAGDYVYYRHVLIALPPLLVGIAIGLGATGAQSGGGGRRAAAWLPLATAVALCMLWIAVNVAVAAVPRYQRDDWRAAARLIPPATGARAVVLEPAWATEPMREYGHPLQLLEAQQKVRVQEIVLVGRVAPAPKPPAGFALVDHRRVQKVAVARYRADAPQPVSPATLAPVFGTTPLAVTVDPAR